MRTSQSTEKEVQSNCSGQSAAGVLAVYSNVVQYAAGLPRSADSWRISMRVSKRAGDFSFSIVLVFFSLRLFPREGGTHIRSAGVLACSDTPNSDQ